MKSLKEVLLKTDTKSWKHGVGVVRYALASFISCIILGGVGLGIGS